MIYGIGTSDQSVPAQSPTLLSVRWENDTEDVQELVRPPGESAMVEALFEGMEPFKNVNNWELNCENVLKLGFWPINMVNTGDFIINHVENNHETKVRHLDWTIQSGDWANHEKCWRPRTGELLAICPHFAASISYFFLLFLFLFNPESHLQRGQPLHVKILVSGSHGTQIPSLSGKCSVKSGSSLHDFSVVSVLFIFFSMFSLVFWLKSIVLWVGHALFLSFFAAPSVVPSFLMIKVKVKNLNEAPTLEFLVKYYMKFVWKQSMYPQFQWISLIFPIKITGFGYTICFFDIAMENPL